MTAGANESGDVLEGATATFAELGISGISVADAADVFRKCAANDPQMSIGNREPGEETLAAMCESGLGMGEEMVLDHLWDVDEEVIDILPIAHINETEERFFPSEKVLILRLSRNLSL